MNYLTAEKKQEIDRVIGLLHTHISRRSADVLRRRYGLPPYTTPQSIIDIAEIFGVTRGRIYQIEQEAYQLLRKAMTCADIS